MKPSLPQPDEASRVRKAPVERRWVPVLLRAAIRVALLLHNLALDLAVRFARHRTVGEAAEGGPIDILVTGTFQADRWLASHLEPLASLDRCRSIFMVATQPIPDLPKLVALQPPSWLYGLVGRTGARLGLFAWEAVRRRPDVVAGFHLLPNGLVAVLMARLVGARSLYFCVSGPRETLGGGVHSDNRLFAQLRAEDPLVERRLLRAVACFDYVVTMGSGAQAYFQGKLGSAMNGKSLVIPGSVDTNVFYPADRSPTEDLIFVGRLSRVKRLDRFLKIVSMLKQKRPSISAVIVGDGGEQQNLEALALELGVESNVRFVGRHADVSGWLRCAALFVLTSDSEGLPLAVMEAMASGLPAVVSDVGDLRDLVEDGVNGYIVTSRAPEDFADRILELLDDDGLRARFGRAAEIAALRNAIPATATRWETLLAAGDPGRRTRG